jgi:hypothetical protein
MIRAGRTSHATATNAGATASAANTHPTAGGRGRTRPTYLSKW